ncbi:transmission trait enhancer LetE [Legionella antarctica]|uniref:Transmission trait enhancer LetE n=1 Tax=Legionella antarctica TaxID=2708020 RepID=A0A6F8T8Q9_9GAMM|nr:transmission trait enhancer LetE [Legionella antarctica]BCA96738.1 transmission trait enhancer LetE [Legionella antarctica]
MNDTTALLPHIKLRFNIDHPSYEECYLFGYECAILEVTEEDNPFREGSQEAEQWLEGWWAGAYGEKPLFDMSSLEEEELKEVRIEKVIAANDQQYCQKNSFLSLVFEISGAIAASAIVGYQLLELVA